MKKIINKKEQKKQEKNTTVKQVALNTKIYKFEEYLKLAIIPIILVLIGAILKPIYDITSPKIEVKWAYIDANVYNRNISTINGIPTYVRTMNILSNEIIDIGYNKNVYIGVIYFRLLRLKNIDDAQIFFSQTDSNGIIMKEKYSVNLKTSINEDGYILMPVFITEEFNNVDIAKLGKADFINNAKSYPHYYPEYITYVDPNYDKPILSLLKKKRSIIEESSESLTMLKIDTHIPSLNDLWGISQ